MGERQTNLSALGRESGHPVPAPADGAQRDVDEARMLADLSPAPLFVLEDGQLTFVNKACAAIVGYSPEEMLTLGIPGMVHPEDLARMLRIAATSLTGGESPASYSTRFLRRGGEVRWADVKAVLVEIGGRKLAVGTVTDVTERVTVENALRESERRWRSLVQTAPSFIVMVDGEGAILDINRVDSSTTFDAIVGSHVYDYVLPEYHGAVHAAIADVIANRRIVAIEYAGVAPAGGSTWYASNLGPVEEDGRVVAVTVVTNDISARKETEDALRQSEARFRSLVETAPSLILMVDREGAILHVNRAGGPTPTASAIGLSVYTHITEEYQELVRKAMDSVFATGCSAVIEHEGIHGDGRKTWYSSSLGPVTHDGVVTAVTVVANEIGERKAMEDALRESEERLRALVQTAPSFICTVDRDGRFISVNRTVPELDLDRVLGHTMFEFVEPEFHDDVREALRVVFEEGRVANYECRGLGPAGAALWYATAAGPTVRDGVVVAATVVSNDITEHKRVESELQALREELEARAAVQFTRGTPYNLSFREIMVMNLVAEGRSDRQMAETLCISPGTVNKHVTNAIRKMGVSNRTEAAARAVRDGII